MTITATSPKLHYDRNENCFVDSRGNGWMCKDCMREHFRFPRSPQFVMFEASTSPEDPESVCVHFDSDFWGYRIPGKHRSGDFIGLFLAASAKLLKVFGDQPKRKLYITLYYWE